MSESKLDKAVKEHAREGRKPLWDGPESSSDQGGITQSMLQRFLVCRERFRVYAIEGLRPVPKFNYRIEFGNLWHACEESNSKGLGWEERLEVEKCVLLKKFPFDRSEVVKWASVVEVQFPIYLGHLKYFKTVRTQLSQEEVFCVSYPLPSGRFVWLRGKLDGVEYHKTKKEVWLREYKTKGDIDEVRIQSELQFDLQTMLYLIAMDFGRDFGRDSSIGGVNYQVIRRPLSGGKGSIRRHKPTKTNPKGETEEEFYARLATDCIAKDPGYWFMNWQIVIAPSDLARFRNEFLDPILEEVCDWYDWAITGELEMRSSANHWRTPYIFNPLLEGGRTEIDRYLNTKSEVGLFRTETLFGELE